MSEMVERVAQAMALDNREPINASPQNGDLPSKDVMDRYRILARAAMAVVRNVDADSPAILVAGKRALYSCSEDPELEDARGRFHAMIDEALRDASPKSDAT